MKTGVKDYMRKVIKDEILAKFTEWRRRSCQFVPLAPHPHPILICDPPWRCCCKLATTEDLCLRNSVALAAQVSISDYISFPCRMRRRIHVCCCASINQRLHQLPASSPRRTAVV